MGFAGTVWNVVWLVLLVVGVWALIDAAIRPTGAYLTLGHKKAYWVAGLAAGIVLSKVPLVGLLGTVASIVYLVEYRPKLRSISRGSGSW